MQLDFDTEAVMADPITVRILINDPLHAVGVATIVNGEPGLSVHNTAADERGDVIVTDLVGHTIENLRLLTRTSADHGTPSVVLNDDTDLDAAELAAAGVARVVHVADATGDVVIAAVRRAHAAIGLTQQQRRFELDRQLARRRSFAAGCHAHALSEREIAVLTHLAEGSNTTKIVKELHMSERTVKYVLRGIMQRVGLRNRVNAVAFAIRAGLI
jgi:DNA-binding NarL/FixJ family response regulator